jgi:elongation factor Ts
VTAEGVVATHIAGTTGAMIEVNCETDFVTKNDSFIAMANAAAAGGRAEPGRHRRAVGAALRAGRLRPHAGRRAQGPDRQDRREHELPPLQRKAGGGKLASYLHGTRIGVVVEFDGDETAAKDVAMHVAAMKPVALTAADVPAELIEKERSVAAAKAAESGKPADIVAKMVEGSVQKFLKEVSLLTRSS